MVWDIHHGTPTWAFSSSFSGRDVEYITLPRARSLHCLGDALRKSKGVIKRRFIIAVASRIWRLFLSDRFTGGYSFVQRGLNSRKSWIGCLRERSLHEIHLIQWSALMYRNAAISLILACEKIIRDFCSELSTCFVETPLPFRLWWHLYFLIERPYIILYCK